jgi:hypothetical protein
MSASEENVSTTEEFVSPPVVEMDQVEIEETQHDEPKTDEQTSIEVAPTKEVAEESVDQVEIPVDTVEIEYPNNVNQTADQFVVSDKGKLDPDESLLTFPGDTAEGVIAAIEKTPNMQVDTPWQQSFKASRLAAVPLGYYTNTIKRKDAKFSQVIKSERGPLTPAEPRFKDNTGTPVTGEHALRRVRSLLGKGSSIQIPCWHSGFWLTLRNPTEVELLELNRKIGEEKIALGRRTWGMALSSMNAIFNNIMMDFVIDHIYDTSVKDMEASDLPAHLSALDWPVVIWGLALSVYRNGFQFSRPCVKNPEQCQHVFTGVINLAKLLWVDETRLSERQIAHMTNRGGSTMSKDSLKVYRDDFVLNHGRDIEVGKEFKLTLKIPMMNESLYIGQRWVNNIVTRVMQLTTAEMSDDQLNHHTDAMSKASYLRQFEPWIEAIDADGLLVKKQRLEDDLLTSLLDELSSDDKIREAVEKEVTDFMSDSTMAIVALTNMECPKCGHRDEDPLPRFKYLVPIEPMMVFFILLGQKVVEINYRG